MTATDSGDPSGTAKRISYIIFVARTMRARALAFLRARPVNGGCQCAMLSTHESRVLSRVVIASLSGRRALLRLRMCRSETIDSRSFISKSRERCCIVSANKWGMQRYTRLISSLLKAPKTERLFLKVKRVCPTWLHRVMKGSAITRHGTTPWRKVESVQLTRH